MNDYVLTELREVSALLDQAWTQVDQLMENACRVDEFEGLAELHNSIKAAWICTRDLRFRHLAHIQKDLAQ